jgi:hypothetical protein
MDAVVTNNPELLPEYIADMEEPFRNWRDELEDFLSLRSAFDVLMQVREILWNIIIEVSDILYTDAL